MWFVEGVILALGATSRYFARRPRAGISVACPTQPALIHAVRKSRFITRTALCHGRTKRRHGPQGDWAEAEGRWTASPGDRGSGGGGCCRVPATSERVGRGRLHAGTRRVHDERYEQRRPTHPDAVQRVLNRDFIFEFQKQMGGGLGLGNPCGTEGQDCWDLSDLELSEGVRLVTREELEV